MELDPDQIRLMRRFDDQMPAVPDWRRSKPTSGSLARIQAHFAIDLPPLLIALSGASHGFVRRFASLGLDEDSPSHIIRINSHWRRRRRTRRIPRGLIIVTMDHHDEHWCLDTNAAADGDDRFPLQFWSPDPMIYPSESDRPTERYPNFATFLRADIYWRRWHDRHRT